MNRLSTKQLQEREEHARTLEAAHGKLEAAICAFNRAQREGWAAIDKARRDYVGTVLSANAWRDARYREGLEFFHGQSREWQDSREGRAYSAWLDALGAELEADTEGLELPKRIDVPEDASESLRELPEEPYEESGQAPCRTMFA